MHTAAIKATTRPTIALPPCTGLALSLFAVSEGTAAPSSSLVGAGARVGVEVAEGPELEKADVVSFT